MKLCLLTVLKLSLWCVQWHFMDTENTCMYLNILAEGTNLRLRTCIYLQLRICISNFARVPHGQATPFASHQTKENSDIRCNAEETRLAPHILQKGMLSRVLQLVL